MRTFSTGAAALLAIAMLAGSAAAADALGKGKIKSINADKKQFVMTGDDKTDHTFTLADHTVINHDGKEGKVTDLKEGQEVSLLYDKGVVNWTVEYILVHEGENAKAGLARGGLKSWDSVKGQLTVTGLDNKDEIFETPVASKVQLAGKPAKLADLKVGDKVTIIYEKDGDKLKVKEVVADRK
jgi:Cu/Ag efflux protein CusF